MHDSIGLFGKLPAQGDFFRSNIADPAVQALVGWLQEAIAPVYRDALRLPASPVRFLFRSPGAQSVVLGAMVASADKVGRMFPLCAFATLPPADVGARWAAVPAAHRPFLDAAAALLGEAAGLDGATVAARARSLPAPAPGDLARADEALRREASALRAVELGRRLFGDLPPGSLGYALATVEAAVSPVRGREPGRAALALDCPAERDVDRWAWLELARRALRWPAPPPFLWTEGAPGRVVVALGAPPTGLLAYLCDPARASNKVWPLRNAQPAAIESARGRLSIAARRALDDPDTTVDALVAAAAAA
jgi:type VI secretion system ImpM family protein